MEHNMMDLTCDIEIIQENIKIPSNTDQKARI